MRWRVEYPCPRQDLIQQNHRRIHISTLEIHCQHSPLRCEERIVFIFSVSQTENESH